MASYARIMTAIMEALRAMVSALGNLEARMNEAISDLSVLRGYDALTVRETIAITKPNCLTDKGIRRNLKAAKDVQY